jgi:biopolymer transport protein ExbD
MAAQIVKHESAPFSEINITPLIDVMLVLLVMIILTIPAATNKVPMDLPAPTKDSTPQEPPHTLEIGRSGALTWDGRAIPDAQLVPLLAAVRAGSAEPVLHMRTDPEARYERFDRVLADVKRSGIERLGFIGDGPIVE